MTSYRGNPGLGVLKGYGQKVTWGWVVAQQGMFFHPRSHPVPVTSSSFMDREVKPKLAILAFLYCGEFAINSNYVLR